MTTNRYTTHTANHSERPGANELHHTVVDTETGTVLVSYPARLNGQAKAIRLAASLNLELGDVIQDSYANPAVVIGFRNRGTSFHDVSIMQLWGSDRGRITSAPLYIIHVDDPAAIEEARAVCRTQARALGLKWNADGFVR